MCVKRKAVFAAVSVLLLSGLCSCSLFDVYLDKSADGSAISTVVGARIIVTLESNVTTGYAWELIELDQSIVEKVSNSYQSGGTAIGAGGTEEWVFLARTAGTTRLKLEYRRSFEPAETPAADSFTVDVTVQ